MIIQTVVNICTIFVLYNWRNDSNNLIQNIILLVGGIFLWIENFLMYRKANLAAALVFKKPMFYLIFKFIVNLVQIGVYGRIFFWYLSHWDLFWIAGKLLSRVSFILIIASFILLVWEWLNIPAVSFNPQCSLFPYP